MKQEKDSISKASEDIDLIFSTIKEIKEKLMSIDALPQEAQQKACEAADQINLLIKESVSYDLENQPPEESSQKAELKDGETKEGTETEVKKKDGPFELPMPSPRSGDTIDDFMTRCMYDTNSRTLYSNEQERFKACMLRGNGFDFRSDKATPPYVDQ